MNLNERRKVFEETKIIAEIQQLLMNYANWYEVLCVDSDRQPIRYCVDNSGQEFAVYN